MQILDARIHASPVPLSTVWNIRITYTLRFEPAEFNGPFEFEDSVRLREEDDTSGDDVIFDWEFPFVFNPTQEFEPVEWTYNSISPLNLDTELGAEEIYGQIFVRDRPTTRVVQSNTNILPIAP
jgi:hypothetical protein